MRYIREHRHSLYLELLMTGKLNSYLADIDRQAEDMLLQMMDKMAKQEGITEQLKTENQMEWFINMNAIKQKAIALVYSELINN